MPDENTPVPLPAQPSRAAAPPEAGLPAPVPAADAPGRLLTAAAERALAEARQRRAAAEAAALPPEKGGRAGPEPVRYGDWEKNGIISDF